jgi:hypothetical protein
MAPRLFPVALVATGVAAALAAWGTFGQSAADGGQTADGESSVWEYLIVLAIIGAAAVAVFGWVAPRALRRESAAWTALALSVLGLLTVAAFWSGLPPILAACGILLGWASRGNARARWAAWAAVGIGTFALVADVAVYVTDMT